MKELDKTKAYDLMDLNDEQLGELLDLLQKEEPNCNWRWFLSSTKFLYYKKEWHETHTTEGREEYFNFIINALTLFEPKLKVGDTFEKDGFICRVEEPIKIWVYDTYQEAYYKVDTINSEYCKEITDQEFINQLEKHAL